MSEALKSALRTVSPEAPIWAEATSRFNKVSDARWSIVEMRPVGIGRHFDCKPGNSQRALAGGAQSGGGHEVLWIWIELPALSAVRALNEASPTVKARRQRLETVDPSLREVVERRD